MRRQGVRRLFLRGRCRGGWRFLREEIEAHLIRRGGARFPLREERRGLRVGLLCRRAKRFMKRRFGFLRVSAEDEKFSCARLFRGLTNDLRDEFGFGLQLRRSSYSEDGDCFAGRLFSRRGLISFDFTRVPERFAAIGMNSAFVAGCGNHGTFSTGTVMNECSVSS